MLFERTGFYLIRFIESIALFFGFIGHLCHSSKNIVTRHLSIPWRNIWKVLYYSGVAIVIPLTIISALMALSLAINSHMILSKFHLQDKALSIALTFLVQDILPVLIGFVLCVQISLSIINARIKIAKLQSTPQEVILEYILPIMIGINITGLLLYTYMIVSVFLSLYFTFHYLLNVSNQVYLLDIARTITLSTFIFSILKTLLYCFIIGITAGYYYYETANRHVQIRRAVSRILTRGSLWLTVSSVSIKFLNL